MTIKTNFFFSLRASGWSETYYQSGSDLNAAFTNALQLATARMLLVGTPCTISYIRNSIVGQQRASQVVAVGPVSSYPFPAPKYTSASDVVGVAALCTAYATLQPVERPLYLRGNPDGLYEAAGGANIDANMWFQAFQNQFQTVLANGTWLLQWRTRLNSDANQVAITAVANLAGTLTSTITLAANTLNFQAGDLVQLYKLKGAQPTPGAVRVLSVAPGGLILTVQYSFQENYLYPGGGIARKLQLNYAPITSALFERNLTKKTGRPFGVSRGRRRSIAR